MLMVVDIGNTNITIGVYDKDTLLDTFRLTSSTTRSRDEFGTILLSFLQASEIKKEDIEHVIISSVVPQMMHAFNNSIKKYLSIDPIIIGPGTKTGISIKTENPKSVGADRIVDLAGCYYTYQGNAIVIDFGTATTFDYISADGAFKYGVVAPGIGICADALSSKCAKLPEIEIKKPDTILASNTTHAMQAGLVYGYIGSVEYIIRKMKEELNISDCLVIATGGLGRIIASNTDLIDIYDPDLTFKGLKIIFDKNFN